MAGNRDHLAGSLDTENTGGLLTGFLAEEEELDRRAMWRLGSWGVASVGAVIVALYASQSAMGLRREQVAAADLARQSQQIQSVARESANEARRLASAIDTLNGDRDRLYSRVTVLEQGLDSVTGAIARQSPAANPRRPPRRPSRRRPHKVPRLWCRRWRRPQRKQGISRPPTPPFPSKARQRWRPLPSRPQTRRRHRRQRR